MILFDEENKQPQLDIHEKKLIWCVGFNNFSLFDDIQTDSEF